MIGQAELLSDKLSACVFGKTGPLFVGQKLACLSPLHQQNITNEINWAIDN